MPDSFELPRMGSTVIKLMGRERFACFRGSIIRKFITFTFWHSIWRGRWFTGWCARLEPCLAAVIRALNDLSKPAAGLRCVDAVGIHRGTLEVIQLPSGKVRTTDVPLFTFSI